VTVSVIVPAVNEERHVAAAVGSAWDSGADEVIVVDGGSRDRTCQRAVEAGAQVLVSLPGRAVQQNEGAGRAAGDVLVFLHADCRLPVDAAVQAEQILADPQVVGGAFRQRIDADGWLYRLLENGNAWRARCRQIPYGDQGLFVRRECFEAVGGFPVVPLMDDLMLARALRRLGRLEFLEGPLVVNARRWEKQGVVRQTLRNWFLLAAWRCGVSLDRLAGFYRRHDR